MKRLRFSLALLFAFAASITSFAHDFELNGIYYNINDDGTSVSVTYKGDSFDLYNEYMGIVFIPEKVTFALKQYDVVSIGDYAFENCNNLLYISIPNTITSIGEMSFKNCTSLKNVILGSSLSDIKDEAFYGCTSIETITSLNVTPPNAYNNIFDSYLFSNTTLYIKADTYGKYWSDSYWRNFTKVERFENTISSLTVEPKIVLNLNKSFSLTPSSDPEENVISKFVFYSNNEDIASVSGNGVITANNIGFTDIYVYTIDGSGAFAKCNVLTQYTKAESLSLSKTVMFINQYDSTILYCNILPEDTHNKTVEWTVNDESIIAIRENGSGSIEILGLIEGTTEVICKTTDGSNLCATCEVTVGTKEGDGSEASPFIVGQVIEGSASGSEVWVSGYIVGWIDGKTISDGAKFDNAATVATNLIIAASMDETDVNNCIPLQLPIGAVRTALNLQANPGNYKKLVSVKGSIEKYFGVTGVKTITEYKLDGEGSDTPVDPTPSEGVTFAKATSVTAGKAYLMYIPSAGIAATAIDAAKTIGYLYTQAVTETSGSITADAALGFTFEATTGGFFIKDSTGRYMYMTGTYNSFNLADAPNASDASYIWTVTIQADGTAQIMNTGMSKWIQYSPTYTSFGSYNSQSGENPVLYEQVDSEIGSTDMEYVDEFEIYTGNKTLHISGDFGIVEVYNIFGIKVYSGNNNEITLDSGIYIVKINDKVLKIAL